MTRPDPPSGFAAVVAAWSVASAGRPRGRRLLGLVLLLGLPVVIVCLGVLFGGDGRGSGFAHFAHFVIYAYTQLVLPLALIAMGTGAFGDEWAGGTPHFVVGLPVSRWTLVVGRWLAVTRAGLAFAIPAIGLVYVLSLAGFGEALGHYVPVLLWVLAVVALLTAAYSAIFLCLGVALRRAVIVSVLYVFAIEVATSKLPQAFATLSLAFHARNLLWQVTAEDAFEPLTRNLEEVDPVSVAGSVGWILFITVLALTLATLRLRRRECGGDGGSRDAEET